MYHRLSSIAQGVWRHYHVPWDQPLSSPTQVAPVWPMSDIHGTVPFHAWSKEHVKYMCVKTPQRKKPHPMITPNRPSDEAIIDYLKRVRRLRPWGMPVQYDVWFRAMMNILPTGSKYRFMETNGPDATKCPYARCQSLETPRHVLHDCICVRALWQAHRPAWRPLGVDLSWDMCMDIDLIEPPAHLANLKETIVQLASSLIMIVVHKLWMHRNTVVHQDAVGPQIARMVYETVVQWSGFVRTALRDPDRPLHSKVHITTIVALLCDDNMYAEVQAHNDNIFSSLALPRRLPRTVAAELDALN
ncbi:hypothetical protein SPRG_14889 [Saprolegnia parasitica CBS 223.65]|uniref:Uncharacterized protein n=1 Tax=Saprolegnia parasitica (strain CBS 223.65) TaxID=695850 RepID=A0A067BMZ2_SAPPC|nr:hypothetical protein SPRG_14889 [Saprolegnia parasitica CBS 223.65]KDO19859.1 hypothetical protein SPRG_14889 [Saprolegnia parasitica CBS 223.65]|eukprot:XP_012209417.1 hypothetical protein SPRG_14889 [Saprolegnia parasitica CBS 223.65]